MSTNTDKTISVAVETSGRVGSVAVARGGTVVASQTFSTQQGHGVELLPTVELLCTWSGVTPADVEHVYVSGGPGSFTGLRIGITFAKTMAFGVGAKVVRVPTLDVIAQNACRIDPRPQRVVVILDAKRRHVYASAFELSGDVYTPLDEPDERDPLTYLPSLGPITALGEGLAYHEQAVRAAENVTIAGAELSRAQADVVHALGRRMAAKNQFTPIERLTPIYIRRPEAEEKWEERSLR